MKEEAAGVKLVMSGQESKVRQVFPQASFIVQCKQGFRHPPPRLHLSITLTFLKLYRYQLFKNNYVTVQSINSKDISWKAGINTFSDRTEEELRAFTGF